MPLKEIGEVPVVDVHRNNFVNFWPSILFACKSASFIAIDAELSGLGPRKKLTERDLSERYKAISDVAKTRAVLSLGVSCFRYGPSSEDDGQYASFAVQTYNITTLCNEDYIVEPAALQFLVDHGFDFNKQYSEGILYHPGADKVTEDGGISIRSLFSQILQCGKPIVVHNGLVDMVFLYQHFYTNLPPTYAQFVVDLSEMFQGGLFDTKYLAEFTARFPSSYLEYVFRWCQRENCSLSRSGERCINLTFQEYKDQLHVEYHAVPLPREYPTGGSRQKICGLYSAFGHCNKKACNETHDLDIILDADFKQAEQKKKRKQRKRKLKRTVPTLQNEEQCETVSSNVEEHDQEGENREPPQKVERKEKTGDEIAESETVVNNGDDMSQAGSMGEPAKTVEVGNPQSGNGVKSVKDQAIPEADSQHLSEECKVDGGQKSQNGIVGDVVDGRGDGRNSKNGRTNTGSSRQHGSHRAGFDAFMTGYALACVVNLHGKLPPEGEGGDGLLRGFGMSDHANKLFLSAKDVPMLIAKSSFAKTSQAHRDKMKKLNR